MADSTIRFHDIFAVVQEGASNFKVLTPGRADRGGAEYGGSAPPLNYNGNVGGMKERFLHVKSKVEEVFSDLSFLTMEKHDYLKKGTVLAILAVENGPTNRPDEASSKVGTGTGMLYVSTDNTSNYNPRITSVSAALSIPQVLRTTGQDNGILDPWNYADSIKAATNYFNTVLHNVEIKGDRDATLLTAAMGYNAGYRRKYASVYWNLKDESGNLQARDYAGKYYQAYNQVLFNLYPDEGIPIDYDKYVASFKLGEEESP